MKSILYIFWISLQANRQAFADRNITVDSIMVAVPPSSTPVVSPTVTPPVISSSGLGGGAIAGIAVAGLVLAVIIVTFVCIFVIVLVRRRK